MAQTSFSSIFKSTSANQQEESNSFTGSLLTGASDIRFESRDPSAGSFSGNNVPGYLSYTLSGTNYTIEGIASRLFKSGSTIQGFYFIESGADFSLASGEQASAYILVYPGRESAFASSPGTYGTSSDPVDSALNSLLAAQPTLTTITQNDADLSVDVGQTVTYTLTFSKDIDATSLTAADLGNTGTATITIGTITETSPGVFTVEVTPTTTGTIKLSILENAQILTPTGLALNTGSAILDDQTLTVASTPISVQAVSARDASSSAGAGDSAVVEGASLAFDVTLSRKTDAVTLIAFSLDAGSTAAAGDIGSYAFTDGVTYDSVTGKLSVPAGVSSFSVIVPTVDDASVESTESVVLSIGGTTSTGSIIDNDATQVSNVLVQDIATGAGAGDRSVVEGGSLLYTVSLTAATTGATTFTLAISGTAAGADYSSFVFSNGVTYDAVAGTISVPTGVSSFTITALTVDDASVESTETLTLTVGGVAATGSITDNDVVSVRSVIAEDGASAPGSGDSTVTEGGTLHYEVTLSAATTGPTTFALSASGTASTQDYAGYTFSNGVTYDSGTGLVTVPTGVSSFTISVATSDDTGVETTETLALSVGGVSSIGTILDNDAIAVSAITAADAAPGASAGDSTVTEGGTLRYSVTLTGATTGVVTLPFSLGGSASPDDYGALTFSNGVTYDPLTGLVTIPLGVSSFTVDVPTTDDASLESTETLTLSVDGVIAAGSIVDNDTLSISGVIAEDAANPGAGDSTVVEGNDLKFTVSLSSAPLVNSTFSFALSGDVSASDYGALVFTNGVTYDPATGLITVPSGVSSFTVTVPTVNDTTVEPTETLTLAVGGLSATGSIQDNDTISVSSLVAEDAATGLGSGDSQVVEGNSLRYVVTLNSTTITSTTLPLTITGDAANTDYGTLTFSNGVTYDPVSGDITIPSGVSSFTITAPTVDDTSVEASETLILTVGGVAATGTITDNDPITVSSVVAKESGGTPGDTSVVEGVTLEYAVTLNATTVATTSLTLAISGTAAGADYSAFTFTNGVTYDAVAGTISIPAGVSSFTISAPTVDDTSVEASETLILTVGGVAATGTITDNDPITVSSVVAKESGGAPGDTSVVEGGTLEYAVTLNATTVATTSLTLAISGTAAGADYSAFTFTNGVTYNAVAGTISIPAGVSSFTITAPTVDDASVEATETLILTVGGVAATGTITDNDPITVSSVVAKDSAGAAGDTSVVEGGTLEYAVTLNALTPATTTLTLAISGTAAGADYSAFTFTNGVTYNALAGTISIPAGVNSFTISVPTVDDSGEEDTETLVLTVGGVGAAGTIADNDEPDEPPTPTIGSIVARDPNGAAGDSEIIEGESLNYRVTLNDTYSNPAQFPLTLSGTALQPDYTSLTFTNGVTYSPSTGLITVPSGVRSFDVIVKTADDSAIEPTETLVLSVGGVSGTGSIVDNDSIRVASVSAKDAAGAVGDSTVVEGGVLEYSVALNATTIAPVSMPFIAAGTAAPGDYSGFLFTNGVTYDAVAGVIRIPVGVSSFKITAATIDDASVETTEALSLSIGGVAATGTILDNDAPAVGVKSIVARDPNGPLGDTNVVEGATLAFAVTLDGPTRAPTALPFALSGDAAAADRGAPSFTNGVTYDPATGLITIPAGVSSFEIRVPTVDDPLVEANETLDVDLAGFRASGLIVDNDAPVGAGSPVYAVRDPGGDVFYAAVAADAAAHAAQTGGTLLGEAFRSAPGGQHLIAYQNWMTGDLFYAPEGAALPYDCYERIGPVPNVQVNPVGAPGGYDIRAYVDFTGRTVFATQEMALSSDLLGRGYSDLGAYFNVPVIGSGVMWSAL